MAGWGLATNLDSTWGEPTPDLNGTQTHQQDHDKVHGVINAIDKDALPSTPVLLAGVAATTATGTTYTLQASDAGKVVECTNGSSVTLTVPGSGAVNFPIGTCVEVFQYGSGTVTVQGSGGSSIVTPSTLILRTQYSSVALRKRAADEWVLAGDTT